MICPGVCVLVHIADKINHIEESVCVYLVKLEASGEASYCQTGIVKPGFSHQPFQILTPYLLVALVLFKSTKLAQVPSLVLISSIMIHTQIDMDKVKHKIRFVCLA